MQFLELIALGSLTIFFAFYLSYLCICLLALKSKQLAQSHASYGFGGRVSLIIPTYNEARAIRRKFDDIRSINFPKEKLEVVFVDGGSVDGTLDLLRTLAGVSNLNVRLISQMHRKGFNNAIIESFEATSGDVVCITGAETEFDPNALNRMLAHFTNGEIGAVTGSERVRFQLGYLPKLEVAYRDLYDIIREAESKIDSLFDIKGEMSASRRSVMAHLVKRPELTEKGSIDCCISFQAKMDGYRAIYEPAAVYYETPPKTIRDSLKQRTRRAATLIQNMLVFKEMILDRKYGYFGMVIMPAHFLMLVVLPVLLLIGVIGVVGIIVLNPSNYLLLLVSGVVLLAIGFLPHLQAFLNTQLALLLALIGLLTGIETQRFERIYSTRT